MNSFKLKLIFHLQTEIGRLLFARLVSAQRSISKRVNENTFYSLIQHFAIVLFECNEMDDFSPAKILMTLSFTFYYEGMQNSFAFIDRRKLIIFLELSWCTRLWTVSWIFVYVFTVSADLASDSVLECRLFWCCPMWTKPSSDSTNDKCKNCVRFKWWRD